MEEHCLETLKLWEPRYPEPTNMDVFRMAVNKEYYLQLEDYWQLYDWSIDEYPKFWEQISKFCNIKFSVPPAQIVDPTKKIYDNPEWFCGSRLNYAENVLNCPDEDHHALIITGEAHNVPKFISHGQLKQRVASYASAMRAIGITSGDCVVGYLPNAQEAVEAFLATAAIGATWSSTSPDFGVKAVLDRFSQIKPKIIFSTDEVIYNGKAHKHLEKLLQVVQGLPQLIKVVIVTNGSSSADDILTIPNSCFLAEFLRSGSTSNGFPPELQFTQVPFSHPLCILYSSGTTGPPKGMVHSVGGTLIQHLKEHKVHGNVKKEDIIFFYTTIGWMMWNWVVSALALGSTLVLYDGSPFLPTSTVIWDLVDQLQISILGTSAKWLTLSEQLEIKPSKSHKLTALHTILSTGSPLKPQSYDYIYRDVKVDLMLGSISGGSDIVSCFMGQNTAIPVYRGEIQSRNLGMAIECYDENGLSVLGSKGELVCTKPFPCMPIYFWDDANGAKYQKAYFSNFKGVWSHGDFCIINPITKGIIMLGRSDSVLNPNGVRFGSAEIYNIVEAFDEVQDSLCVSQNLKSGEERVILFVKLINGTVLEKPFLEKIKSAIREQLSARHVPAIILPTKDIPYTISGKKVEIAVKKIISGEDEQQRGALSNPNSLDLYYNIPQLREY